MEANNYPGKIKAVEKLAEKLTHKGPYHNFAHELDVYRTVSLLAKLENISVEDKFLLQTAALLHDNFYQPYNLLNEEKSVERAKNHLLKIGYSIEQIRRIKALILATKMPQKPANLLEKLLCDADLDNLGRKDFFELGEKIRIEFGLSNNEEGYQRQLQFLQAHQYHTEVARKLRDTGKQENIEKLKKLLEEK